MDKKTRGHLSLFLVICIAFTSLFTGVVFADDTAKASESLEAYIAKCEENPVTTSEAITYTLTGQALKRGDTEITDQQGSNAYGEAAGLWVDATGGKYNSGRGDQWVQINNGTVIYVPVNGKSTITVNSYAGYKYTVEDAAEGTGYDGEVFDFSSTASGNVLTYEGKSTGAVKITLSDSSNGYISSITVKSEGVQEGEIAKTWEQRNFSLKINGTLVSVAGAEKITTSAAITLDDDDAKVVSAEAKSGSIQIDLPKTGITGGMLTDLSDGITAEVSEDGDVIVTFTGAEIEPKEFTISVAPKFTKKEFSLKVEGKEISASFSEEGKAPTITADDGAEVITAGAEKAVCGIDLGGGELTKASVTDASSNIETTITTGGGINIIGIEFTDKDENGNLSKPWEYEIDITDSSVTTYPEKGYSATYDFWTEMKEGDQNNKVLLDSFLSDDGFMMIKKGDGNQFYRHDSAHGIAVYNGNSFEVKVAGNAAVTFTGCMYGGACDIAASVKDPESGTITPESGTLSAGSGNEAACGRTLSFAYTGEETTLIFTVATTGETYIHNMSVSNDKDMIEANGKTDVWDFGAATLDTEKYNNWLTADFLNGLYDSSITAGSAATSLTFPASFEAGDLSYSGKEGSNRLRTTNTALTRYDDGSSTGSVKGFDCSSLGITGCLYLNGASGASQGIFTINLLKDDVVYVYIKMDNADDYLLFTKSGSNEPTEVFASVEGSICKFVAPEDGAYTIYDSTAAGKARYYRIVREHAKYSTVSGEITYGATAEPDEEILYGDADQNTYITAVDAAVTLLAAIDPNKKLTGKARKAANVDGDGVIAANDAVAILEKVLDDTVIFKAKKDEPSDMPEDGFGIIIRNEETRMETKADITDGKYSASIPMGYTYTLRLDDAIGFRISDGAKIEDFSSDTENNIKIRPVAYHSYTGKIYGIPEELIENVRLIYVPKDADDELSYGEAEVTITTGAVVDGDALVTGGTISAGYSAQLAENIEYEIVMEGANDYEITEGAEVTVGEDDVTADIKCQHKAVYKATGKFTSSDGGKVTVSKITLTRKDDGYTYTPEITEEGYSVELCDGVYTVTADAEGYKQATHLVINGGALDKDIYFVPTTTKEVSYVSDIYVGKGLENSENYYATLKEAIDAVNAMPSGDNDKRVTIHIAPGTYRAQYILKRPNVSLINTDSTGTVLVTWYYGIAYKYYSADSTGYYNELNAADKYLMNGKETEKTADVSKWGCTFYLQSTAKGFIAEGISFENSFNKYITEEELADGVAPDGTGLTYDRTKANTAGARSREATERAAAMVSEADMTEFYNCSFSSSQDTLYMGNTTRQYFKNCFAEGMTDYIFGDGQIVFEDCQLNLCGYSNNTAGAHITAVRHEKNEKGYLFYNCKITADLEDGMQIGSSNDLGRPWGAGATVYYINTTIGKGLLTTRGYADMSGVKPENQNYYEYNNKLDDETVYKSTAGTQLTDEQAAAINVSDWFKPTITGHSGEWTPTHYEASADE